MTSFFFRFFYTRAVVAIGHNFTAMAQQNLCVDILLPEDTLDTFRKSL